MRCFPVTIGEGDGNMEIYGSSYDADEYAGGVFRVEDDGSITVITRDHQKGRIFDFPEGSKVTPEDIESDLEDWYYKWERFWN